MEKNTTRSFNLGLTYDDGSSFDLTTFYKEKKIQGFGGEREAFLE